MPLTEQEVRSIAKEAARETVNEFFDHFGFDMNDHREVQADMRAVRDWRMAQKSIRKTALATVITILITGFCALIWTSIRGG